jgi:hypothetical protein
MGIGLAAGLFIASTIFLLVLYWPSSTTTPPASKEAPPPSTTTTLSDGDTCSSVGSVDFGNNTTISLNDAFNDAEVVAVVTAGLTAIHTFYLFTNKFGNQTFVEYNGDGKVVATQSLTGNTRYIAVTALATTVVAVIENKKDLAGKSVTMEFLTYENTDPDGVWLDTDKLVVGAGQSLLFTTDRWDTVEPGAVFLADPNTMFVMFKPRKITGTGGVIKKTSRINTTSPWEAFTTFYKFVGASYRNTNTFASGNGTLVCSVLSDEDETSNVIGSLGLLVLTSDTSWSKKPVAQDLDNGDATFVVALALSTNSVWLMFTRLRLPDARGDARQIIATVFYYKKNTVNNRYSLEHTASYYDSFVGCASLYCSNDGSALVFGHNMFLSVPAGGDLKQAKRTRFEGITTNVYFMVGTRNGMCTARTSSATRELVYSVWCYVSTQGGKARMFVHRFTAVCVA